MRLYSGGEAVELDPADGVAERLGDRVWVRTTEGTFSGIAIRSGGAILVSYQGQTFRFETSKARAGSAGVVGNEVRAPMPGLIVRILVEEGEQVVAGQRVMVLEAMKTQQPLTAPQEGRIVRVLVQPGAQVQQGALLVEFEPGQAG
jgi:3-methylcrotonyl-CoA carboxylase alpha subunit